MRYVTLFPCAMALVLCIQASGAIRYVSKDGSDEPPYLTRETAARSIPPAMEIAEPGDTLLVSAGLYYAPWTGALWVPGGVTLRGEGAYLTIIDFEATLEDNVLYATLGAADAAVVEDVWIGDSRGASVGCGGSPKFRRCTLGRVELGAHAGAIFEDCLFYGGEMLECRDYSAPHFRRCTFFAYDEGRVLCRGESKPVFDNCRFIDAGVGLADDSAGTFDRCEDMYVGVGKGATAEMLGCYGCKASSTRGSILIRSSVVRLASCTEGYMLIQNSICKEGPRQWCCLFAGDDAVLEIRNCTVAGNGTAVALGGSVAPRSLTLENTILAGNQVDFAGTTDVVHCSYSLVPPELVGTGPGNISSEPRFVDAERGDFQPRGDSPCIDAGFNHPDLPEFDIAGMHRIMFGGKSLTVDMGAYEFYINKLDPVPGADQAIFTWSSLADKSYSIFYTDDLFTWHVAVENFPSSGNTTTSWLDDGALTGIPPLLAPQRFYRVLENP